MTRKTNARLAGFTFLFYIAVGLTSMALDNRAMNAPDPAGKLARLAERCAAVRLRLRAGDRRRAQAAAGRVMRRRGSGIPRPPKGL